MGKNVNTQSVELVSNRSRAWLQRETGTGFASGVLGRYIFDARECRNTDGTIDLEKIGFSPTNYRRFSQRVVWFEDNLAAWVDLDRVYQPEIRTITLASPTQEALDAATAEVAAIPFDHSRPLWDITIIDGLGDDRIAVIYRIHESVTEGTLTPFDAVDPSARPPQPQMQHVLDARSDARKQAIRSRVRRFPKAVVHAATVAAKAVKLRNPWMTGVCSGERYVRSFNVPIEVIREVHRTTGVRFNDVVLAMIAEGIMTGLRDAGVNASHVGLMNISARVIEDRSAISAWFVSSTTADGSFEECCHTLAAQTEWWRAAKLDEGAELMTDLGMSTWRFAKPPKRKSAIAHVVVSNLGSFAPMFAFSSAPMLEAHFVGAVTAQGPINISIVSGPRDAHVAMQIDLGAVPFGVALADGIAAEAQRLISSAEDSSTSHTSEESVLV